MKSGWCWDLSYDGSGLYSTFLWERETINLLGMASEVILNQCWGGSASVIRIRHFSKDPDPNKNRCKFIYLKEILEEKKIDLIMGPAFWESIPLASTIVQPAWYRGDPAILPPQQIFYTKNENTPDS